MSVTYVEQLYKIIQPQWKEEDSSVFDGLVSQEGLEQKGNTKPKNQADVIASYILVFPRPADLGDLLLFILFIIYCISCLLLRPVLYLCLVTAFQFRGFEV